MVVRGRSRAIPVLETFDVKTITAKSMTPLATCSTSATPHHTATNAKRWQAHSCGRNPWWRGPRLMNL